MKINGKQYQTMLNAMRANIEAHGLQTIQERASTSNHRRLLWELWHECADNLYYDDTHTCFVHGLWRRFIERDLTFDQYADYIDDSHIETALFAIARECGLKVSRKL